MKALSFSRMCIAGVLIVAMIVAWCAAMPNHMSHDRLAMVGGCDDCEYQSLDWSYPDCPSHLDCTGTRLLMSGTSSNPNIWIIIEDGHCSGSGSKCDDIINWDCSTECEHTS